MKKIITILTMGIIAATIVFAADDDGLSKAAKEQNEANIAVAQASNTPGKAMGPLGAGMVVIGAGIGIGMFASSAARSIARQPEAAKEITGAVNLPLFLLEGVAIIALVVCLLATF